MTIRTGVGIGCLVLAQGLAGCSGSGARSALSAPSPIPQPTPTRTPNGSLSMKGTVREAPTRELCLARGAQAAKDTNQTQTETAWLSATP